MSDDNNQLASGIELVVGRTDRAVSTELMGALSVNEYGILCRNRQIAISGWSDEMVVNAINYHFGSMEGFKRQMTDAAMNLFGSGWVWLAADTEGRLRIIKEAGGGNPWRHGLIPILGIDCWEHSSPSFLLLVPFNILLPL